MILPCLNKVYNNNNKWLDRTHNTRKHDQISAGKTPPIYLENISVESPSSIDYKYVRFRLAQIRRSIL